MANIHDEYRQKFHDTKAKVDAIEAKIAPLQAEREKLQATIQPTVDKIRVIEGQVRDLKESGNLFDLKNEMALYVRALGGKTGIRQADGSIVMPEKKPEEAAQAEPAKEEIGGPIKK